MENSIKPTTALLILLLFGGLLIGKFWAAHQATAVPGPRTHVQPTQAAPTRASTTSDVLIAL